jgi:hypothetical protein
MSIFNKKSKLSKEFVEANKRAIALGMEGPEEAFNSSLGSSDLIGPEMRGYLPVFHSAVLMKALTGSLGTYSDHSKNRTFLDQALARDTWQARTLHPEVAEVLLTLKRFSDVPGFPAASDHIEYAGRIMPDMLLLIAYGFKRGQSQQYLWRDRVDEAISLYEGRAGKIASKRVSIKR